MFFLVRSFSAVFWESQKSGESFLTFYEFIREEEDENGIEDQQPGKT